MSEEEIVLECIKECKDSEEKPRCISLCCKEKGVDPVKGIIIATIYEENFYFQLTPRFITNKLV